MQKPVECPGPSVIEMTEGCCDQVSAMSREVQ